MIGFYDYTVILTYAGALAGLLGIVLSFRQQFLGAILCMAVSLFCDTLDGKVARAKKNRTEEEMLFGIQIDSLCDLISFGVCPAAFFYNLGMNSLGDYLLLGAYCLCCVIRLGFFNVLAVQGELGKKSDFRGFPVVCLDVAVPFVYLLFLLSADGLGIWELRFAAVLFGLLYIWDIPVKKPNLWKYAAMAAAFWVPVGVLLRRR